MGAAISSNVSNQIINTSTSIANNYVQGCTGNAGQTFGLTITNGCNSSIGTINITNDAVINTQCLTNNTTKSSMQSDIAAQVKSQILAAVQSIGGPALTIANDVDSFSQNVAQTITNLYTQECVSNATQSQQITCSDPGSSNTIGVININNSQNVYTACTQNSSTISDLKGEVTVKIKTLTNASEANTASTFVIAGLIVLAFIGIFFVYSINGPIGWVVVGIFLLIIIAIVVYATVAFTDKLYPFNQQIATA